MKTRFVFAMVCSLGLPVFAADWQSKSSPLTTKWAANVTPENVHREYPRPQCVRETWLNLNGLWDYSIQPKSAGQPMTWESEKILVPFPVESALSGVKKFVGSENRLWYRHSFSIPNQNGATDPAWQDKSILLHFGAVDWETTVWMNGKEIGSHKGGYDPFSFDVSAHLKLDGPNELIVSVWDPTDEGFQGRGKQVRKPGGIFYTPTTGIWQTVWLEPVPKSFIRQVALTPDLDQGLITIKADIANPQPGWKLGIVVSTPTTAGGFFTRQWHTELGMSAVVAFDIRDPQFIEFIWSPDNPHLIDVYVALVSDSNADLAGLGQDWLPQGATIAEKKPETKLHDWVKCYTAMRKISLGKDEQGINRLLLNNQPVFQVGPLDQGFWPDGLYTAPSDDALKFDIEQTKAFGFNLIRKHVKVEPDRWYYHCDRLGMLVWQDMPSGDQPAKWDPFGKFDHQENRRSPESAEDYRREWKSIIDTLRNHPCIVMWVPFNEGWGQSDTIAITQWTKQYDPTRLVNCASGGNDFPVGDVIDVHRYPGPFAPKPTNERAAVLGEFGGLGLPLEEHTWQGKENWGYVSFKDQTALSAAYEDLFDQLHPLIASPGLSAAIYTQTTDVETEVNGLMTYDRKIVKIPVEALKKAHARLHRPAPTMRVVVPDSRTDAQTWKYVLEKPTEDWFKRDFNDGPWKTSNGGFGEKSTPGSVVGTEWKSKDIWLRRDFELKQPISGEVRLVMHHDDEAEVFVNGIRATKVAGWATDYRTFAISEEAAKSLTPGKNSIAVYCHQDAGGQYVDVGIVELIPASAR